MKEESLLLLSDLQKLINQVVLIDYTIIILGGVDMEKGINEFNSENNIFMMVIENKNVSDIKHVMNEYVEFGYDKVIECEYNGDTILIYAKKQ